LLLSLVPGFANYRLDYSKEHQACKVVWTGTTDYGPDDLPQPPEPPENKTENSEAKQLLLGLLSNGPMPAQECSAAAKK
jgi:hypothetical protein